MDKGRRILVTGAAGFIGRHLVEALAGEGNEVCGLLGPGDRWPAGSQASVAWHRADVTDRESLRGLPWPFYSIVHLAGLLSSFRQDSFYAVNFEGTRNLAEEAVSRKLPGRFLLASSLAATGPSEGGAALSETHPCRPISDYGRSKLMAELCLRAMAGALETTIVRLPLVYGPGSTGGLFAYFRQIRKHIYIDLGDRLSTVGYVGDIVRGIKAALEAPLAAGQTYFLGEERPYESGEIIAAIRAAVGTRAVRIKVPHRLGYCGVAVYETVCRLKKRKAAIKRQDMRSYIKHPDWIADTAKAVREIGYKTSVPLAEGARLTAAWYRSRGIL